MPRATASRRRLIVLVLLGLALVGGGLRLGTPKASLAHDIGNLLLVLWVPVIGNVVAWVMRQATLRMKRPRGFAVGSPFAGHLLVELVPQPQVQALPDQETCTLVIGSDGFTARAALPVAQWLGLAQARTTELQLLRPALALPRLQPGTSFSVLVGQTAAATGRVVRWLA